MVDFDLISIRTKHSRAKIPPLGLLSLASSLNVHGLSWHIYDTQFDSDMNAFAVQHLAKIISECDSHIIGLSVLNDSIPLVIAALDQIECLSPDQKIIIGGPGVVGIASELLSRSHAINYVFVGEGESTLPMFIKDKNKIGDYPGVFSHLDKISGSGKSRREDFECLPTPCWDWCENRGYEAIPILTMRGCPFQCRFCDIIGIMGQEVYQRDVNDVIDDLVSALSIIKSNHVEIVDDTFTLRKQYVLKFCKGLRRLAPKISFSVFSRTDTIDKEMMEALAEAGCNHIFFGVDAGDNHILKLIKKGITIEDAEKVLLQAANFFDVTASFIWGYPFETIDAFQRMIDFAEKLLMKKVYYRIWPHLHLLSPSVVTPIFKEYKDSILLDLDADLQTIAGSIRGNSFRKGYKDVLEIIEKEKKLSMPYYRYRTPCFYKKSELVYNYNKEFDCIVGQTIIEALNFEGVKE